MIEVRTAQPEDADMMAELLNAIIDAGGTTSRTQETFGTELLDMQAALLRKWCEGFPV